MEQVVEAWKKRFDRERQARKNAEKLLEEKSLQLWYLNQGLENQVKERTQALEEALAQAQEANVAKDRFLSMMSHELRTPLNAIIGFAQILVMRPDTPDQTKGYIEKIGVAGKNLLELVNTILDFSKIAAEKTEFHPSHFGLDGLVDEVRILVETMAGQKEITLAFEKPQDVQLFGDKQLIKQVLLNLLSNAIKFSPSQTVVHVVVVAQEKHWKISVTDQGVGIEEGLKEHIFDPFTQIAKHQKGALKGTGLGLAICKKIVLMHGGQMWVESEEGAGSTFYFTLPQSEG